jgi:four helix bundle protein
VSTRSVGQDILTRTFAFAVRIVLLCQHLEEQPGVGQTLGRQLLHSGTSIGARVEEAQAGPVRANFIGKYSIALKEARETRYWLRLLVATRVVPESRVSGLLTEIEELVRIINAIIVTARKSK